MLELRTLNRACDSLARSTHRQQYLDQSNALLPRFDEGRDIADIRTATEIIKTHPMRKDVDHT